MYVFIYVSARNSVCVHHYVCMCMYVYSHVCIFKQQQQGHIYWLQNFLKGRRSIWFKIDSTVRCHPFTKSIKYDIKKNFISPQTSTHQHRIHVPLALTHARKHRHSLPSQPQHRPIASPRTLTGLQVAATGTEDIPSEREGEQRDKKTRLPLETGVAGGSTLHTGSFVACIAADWCVTPPTATLSDSKLRLLGVYFPLLPLFPLPLPTFCFPSCFVFLPPFPSL